MGYEFEKGLERGMAGKTSTGFSDEVCPFRGDEEKAERQRGYEAGVAARALADAVAESSDDSSSSDNSSSYDSSYYSSSSTSYGSSPANDSTAPVWGCLLGIAAVVVLLYIAVNIFAAVVSVMTPAVNQQPANNNYTTIPTQTKGRTYALGEQQDFPTAAPTFWIFSNESYPANEGTIESTVKALFWAGNPPDLFDNNRGVDLNRIDINKTYFQPIPGEHGVSLINTGSSNRLWNYQAIDDDNKLMMSFQILSPYHIESVEKYSVKLKKRLRIVETTDRQTGGDGRISHYVVRYIITPPN